VAFNDVDIYVAFNDVDRLYCFSLGDFHNYDKCLFDFLVRHHLQKRYDLEEGNKNLTIGNILDLVMKIIHRSKAYNQPLEYILSGIFKAAENEMRFKVERAGAKSFYGSTIPFLTEENINEAKAVFKRYYELKKGKFNRSVINEKFWECMLEARQASGLAGQVLKLWGGPDALEMGEDGVVEVVDYKYFENPQKGRDNLDMDLAPKLYTLLCAEELLKQGHKKARFRIISWTDPLDNSLYEEFDLQIVSNLKDFFRVKIEKMLGAIELSFCEKPYCKSCNSEQKEIWIKELKVKKFIQG
jgi:hypothetical protein